MVSDQPVRRVEGRRLAYYRRQAGVAFWEQHWKNHLSREQYTWAEAGGLGWLEKPAARYLPDNGRILEAGCGLGQCVMALRTRGFDAEGVDSAAQTIEAVRALFPDLPIRTGDVLNLDVPDKYYKGLISLGVVEHRQDGPEPFMREAYRVLAPGGVAIFTVPFFHYLRRLKARAGFYRGRVSGLEFYQYAFSEDEFRFLLQSEGFKIIDYTLYDGYKGIKDEIAPVRWLLRRRGIGPRLMRVLQSWQWAGRNLGHMIMFICRKP